MKIKFFLFLFIGLIISQRLDAKIGIPGGRKFSENCEYLHHEGDRLKNQREKIERICTKLKMASPKDGSSVEGIVKVSADAFGYGYIPKQENTEFEISGEGYYTVKKPTDYCYDFLYDTSDESYIPPNCMISAWWDTTKVPNGWYWIDVCETIQYGSPPIPGFIFSEKIKVYVNNKFMVRISPTKQYFYKGGITKSHKITIENKTNKEFTANLSLTKTKDSSCLSVTKEPEKSLTLPPEGNGETSISITSKDPLKEGDDLIHSLSVSIPGIPDENIEYPTGKEIRDISEPDTTQPKIKKTKVLKGKKDISGNIVDATTVYSKDYETNKITSEPMVGEGNLFVELTFDEEMDRDKPLNVFFSSDNHPVSYCFWSNTNTTWLGEFFIPRNSEYQGTHTLSISDATDLAGNTFDADPTTEQIDPDTSNQFQIFLPDIAYTQWSPVPNSTKKEGSTRLLNIESKESIRLSGGCNPQFFPDGEWLALHGGGTPTGDVDIWKIGIDGRSPQNLTNSPKSEGNFLIAKDGKKIIFEREIKASNQDIFVLDLEQGKETNLTNSDMKLEYIWNISHTQKKILYSSKSYGGAEPEEIWIMDMDGSNKRMLILGKDENGTNIWIDVSPRAIFSPDGSKIFYSRDVFTYDNEGKISSANIEIYSINVDGSDNRRITNTPEEDEVINDINDTKLLYKVITKNG
ncbi:MAG: hypothetical protein AB1630_10900, partial [bacterium]